MILNNALNTIRKATGLDQKKKGSGLALYSNAFDWIDNVAELPWINNYAALTPATLHLLRHLKALAAIRTACHFISPRWNDIESALNILNRMQTVSAPTSNHTASYNTVKLDPLISQGYNFCMQMSYCTLSATTRQYMH